MAHRQWHWMVGMSVAVLTRFFGRKFLLNQTHIYTRRSAPKRPNMIFSGRKTYLYNLYNVFRTSKPRIWRRGGKRRCHQPIILALSRHWLLTQSLSIAMLLASTCMQPRRLRQGEDGRCHQPIIWHVNNARISRNEV